MTWGKYQSRKLLDCSRNDFNAVNFINIRQRCHVCQWYVLNTFGDLYFLFLIFIVRRIDVSVNFSQLKRFYNIKRGFF